MSPEAAVEKWVREFVVGYSLCPFAAQPLREGRVRFTTCEEADPEAITRQFLSEVLLLSEHDAETLETSLIVYSKAWKDFEEFLAFIDLCEELLVAAEADELVQLAHFHPDYRFAGVAADDPGNLTNRSPYSCLQLIRVASVAQARNQYADIEKIPERNVALMRERFS